MRRTAAKGSAQQQGDSRRVRRDQEEAHRFGRDQKATGNKTYKNTYYLLNREGKKQINLMLKMHMTIIGNLIYI